MRSLHKDIYLTLFRMGLFGAAHGWGWGKKALLPNTYNAIMKGPPPHTYNAIMKLDRVIPYLKKIQKMYESSDTLLGFC